MFCFNFLFCNLSHSPLYPYNFLYSLPLYFICYDFPFQCSLPGINALIVFESSLGAPLRFHLHIALPSLTFVHPQPFPFPIHQSPSHYPLCFVHILYVLHTLSPSISASSHYTLIVSSPFDPERHSLTNSYRPKRTVFGINRKLWTKWTAKWVVYEMVGVRNGRSSKIVGLRSDVFTNLLVNYKP